MIRSTLKKIAKRILLPLITSSSTPNSMQKNASDGKSTAGQVPPVKAAPSDPTRFNTLLDTLSELTDSDTKVVELVHLRNTLTITLSGGATSSESSLAATRLALQRLILGNFSDLKKVEILSV
jgi:hypothetical protein